MASNFSVHNNKKQINKSQHNNKNNVFLDTVFLWHLTEWQLKLVIAQIIINVSKSLLKLYNK